MDEIVFVTDLDVSHQGKGGIATYMSCLLKFLRKKAKITLIGKKEEKSSKNSYVADQFINIIGQSNYSFFLNLFKLDKSFIKDSAIIVAQRPDFLYPFLMFKNKKIVTIHGDPASVILKKKGLLTYVIYKFFELKSLRKCNKVIFIDSVAHNNYIKKYPWLKNKSCVIPPGVDVDLFRPLKKEECRRKLNFPKNSRILVFIGRFEPEKNIDKIIKEFMQINDWNYNLVLVGSGRELKNTEKISASDKRIRIMTDVNHYEIPVYLGSSDALVLMSSHEGLPTVILEAFACGIPVLSRNAGDIKKIVVNNKTGYIIEFGQLQKYFDLAVARSSILRPNCINMSKKYSWSKIGKEIFEAFRK